MKEARSGKVWSCVPYMDVHTFRSNHCTEIYNTLARPIEKISKNERYHCRLDLKGVCYDKHTMLIASRCLGHIRIKILQNIIYGNSRPTAICGHISGKSFIFKSVCHIVLYTLFLETKKQESLILHFPAFFN